MMRRHFLMILFFYSGFVALAQNDNLDKDWTLEECISYAIENNITVKDATLGESTAETNYSKAKYQRLPNLSLNLNEGLTFGTSIDPITSAFVSQTIASTSIGLNSQVSLFAGKQLTNQIKQNKMLWEQSELLTAESKNSIKINVVQAYLQLLYNWESVKTAEINLKSASEEQKAAKTKLEIGSITAYDLATFDSQVATAQYNLAQAENNYKQQLLTLRQLLEIQPEEKFEVKLSELEYETWIVPDKIEIYNKAIAELPQVQSDKLQLEIDQKTLDITKGSYYPTVSLSAGLSSGYTSTRDYSFGSQLETNFNRQLSLSLNFPIFNRNQTKLEVQNAKINIQKSEIQLKSTQKELYQKVETAWQNAISYQSQITSTKKAMESSELSYELALEKYNIGELSITDLITTQNTYFNTKQSYLQAKYMSVMYKLLLDFYQGKELKI